jgi:hypothetical protein
MAPLCGFSDSVATLSIVNFGVAFRAPFLLSLCFAARRTSTSQVSYVATWVSFLLGLANGYIIGDWRDWY